MKNINFTKKDNYQQNEILKRYNLSQQTKYFMLFYCRQTISEKIDKYILAGSSVFLEQKRFSKYWKMLLLFFSFQKML